MKFNHLIDTHKIALKRIMSNNSIDLTTNLVILRRLFSKKDVSGSMKSY